MTPLDPTQPAVGVTPELQRLLALRFAARQLDIRRRRKSLAQLAGSQRSNFRRPRTGVRRGQGLPGRRRHPRHRLAGDGRAPGRRTPSSFTRTASAPCSWWWISAPPCVSVPAIVSRAFSPQKLAALLAWSALDANERVGALLMDADNHRELRPRATARRAVLALLSGCANPAVVTEEKLSLADILRSAAAWPHREQPVSHQ